MPSSTSGSSASCCALLKRWISSMNSSVRVPVGGQLVAGLVEHLAQLLHAAGDGAELPEDALAFRWPAAGRASSCPCPAGRRRSPSRAGRPSISRRSSLPSPRKCCWPTNSVERPRPHPRRQRLGAAAVLGFGGFE